MPNLNTTIAGWLFDEGRVGLERAADSEPIAALKDALARHATAIPWATAQHAVEEKIADALTIDAGGLLLATWLRSALLVKYLDSSRYPPDQTILAHLAEHTIEMKLQPKIEVYSGQLLITTIPVKAIVSATVKGFILTIKGGHVLQMTTGNCQAKGQLSVAGVVVTEKKSKVVELPGVIRFGEGRRITAAGT